MSKAGGIGDGGYSSIRGFSFEDGFHDHAHGSVVYRAEGIGGAGDLLLSIAE
jgi:hypothetical protein